MLNFKTVLKKTLTAASISSKLFFFFKSHLRLLVDKCPCLGFENADYGSKRNVSLFCPERCQLCSDITQEYLYNELVHKFFFNYQLLDYQYKMIYTLCT